jgi:hypothetical protein
MSRENSPKNYQLDSRAYYPSQQMAIGTWGSSRFHHYIAKPDFLVEKPDYKYEDELNSLHWGALSPETSNEQKLIAHVKLAEIYARLDNDEEAIDEFNQALKLNQNCELLHCKMFEFYVNKDKNLSDEYYNLIHPQKEKATETDLGFYRIYFGKETGDKCVDERNKIYNQAMASLELQSFEMLKSVNSIDADIEEEKKNSYKLESNGKISIIDNYMPKATPKTDEPMARSTSSSININNSNSSMDLSLTTSPRENSQSGSFSEILYKGFGSFVDMVSSSFQGSTPNSLDSHKR